MDLVWHSQRPGKVRKGCRCVSDKQEHRGRERPHPQHRLVAAAEAACGQGLFKTAHQRGPGMAASGLDHPAQSRRRAAAPHVPLPRKPGKERHGVPHRLVGLRQERRAFSKYKSRLPRRRHGVFRGGGATAADREGRTSRGGRVGAQGGLLVSHAGDEPGCEEEAAGRGREMALYTVLLEEDLQWPV